MSGFHLRLFRGRSLAGKARWRSFLAQADGRIDPRRAKCRVKTCGGPQIMHDFETQGHRVWGERGIG
jgi:hypothetical protein